MSEKALHVMLVILNAAPIEWKETLYPIMQGVVAEELDQQKSVLYSIELLILSDNK